MSSEEDKDSVGVPHSTHVPKVVVCHFTKRTPVPMAPPDVVIPVKVVQEDPVPKLKEAQNYGGSWSPSAALASVLETTEEEILAKMPFKDCEPDVWATLLALIWLHATCQDHYDDWEILKAGAICWLRTIQDLRLADCVKAGNTLLGTEVAAVVFNI